MESPNSEINNPGQFLELVNAFRISRIILSAAELKVFDYLDGEGKTSDQVAIILWTNPRATDRLLNALVSIGLLQKEADHFSNTPFASKFLVTSSPAYMSGLALTNHTWRTWSTLTKAVKEGTSVHFEDPINDRPEEWQEAFIAAMHRRAGPQAVEVADALDLAGVKRVLDVGGGSGAFTMEFLNRNQEMTGVVFDLPKIVGITEKYLCDKGYAIRDTRKMMPDPGNRIPDRVSLIPDRISVMAGDYLKDDFGSGFDLVFMSAIIHINSPAENQLLIQKGANALNPGGQLVILDHIMSEDRTEPQVGAIFAINMLVGTKHGDTYTEDELRSWMLDAGLSDISQVTTSSGVQLIMGGK
ncbi:MAG: methyltransferase domain-containing protein [Bacteroidales bacterium]|nr:methyltransferase domain-containing protein [Bacteroidales bacterium]